MKWVPAKFIMLAVRNRRMASVVFAQHESKKSTKSIRSLFCIISFLIIGHILLALSEEMFSETGQQNPNFRFFGHAYCTLLCLHEEHLTITIK